MDFPVCQVDFPVRLVDFPVRLVDLPVRLVDSIHCLSDGQVTFLAIFVRRSSKATEKGLWASVQWFQIAHGGTCKVNFLTHVRD